MDTDNRKKTFDLTKIPTTESSCNKSQPPNGDGAGKLHGDSSTQTGTANPEDLRRKTLDLTKLSTESASLTPNEPPVKHDNAETFENRSSLPEGSVLLKPPDVDHTTSEKIASSSITSQTSVSPVDNPVMAASKTDNAPQAAISTTFVMKLKSAFFILLGVVLMFVGLFGFIVSITENTTRSHSNLFTGLSLGLILLFTGYRAFRYKNKIKHLKLFSYIHFKLTVSYCFIILSMPVLFSGIGALLDGNNDKTWGNVFAGSMFLLLGLTYSRNLFFKNLSGSEEGGVEKAQPIITPRGESIHGLHATDVSCDNIFIAASQGSTARVLELLANGANIEGKDDKGLTALMWAVAVGHIETATLLIDKGANIEARDENGYTALILAASIGQKETAKLVIDKGANIEAKAKSGSTALMAASGMGYVEIVKLLIDKGVDIEERNDAGATALIWSAINGHTETVQVLIEKGANIEAQGNDGLTALMYAKDKGHTEIVKLLKGAKIKKTKQIEGKEIQPAITPKLIEDIVVLLFLTAAQDGDVSENEQTAISFKLASWCKKFNTDPKGIYTSATNKFYSMMEKKDAEEKLNEVSNLMGNVKNSLTSVDLKKLIEDMEYIGKSDGRFTEEEKSLISFVREFFSD